MIGDVPKHEKRTLPDAAESDRWQLLLEATSDAVWDFDLTTGNGWCSKQFNELFGYADFPITREFWLSTLHPDDKAQVLASLDLTIKEHRRNFQHSYRVRRADGSYAYVMNRGRVLYGPDHTPIRMVGAVTDISQQTIARQQSEEIAKRFELLANITNDALYDWDVQTDATWYNDQFYSLLGYTERPPSPPPNIWSNALVTDDKQRVFAEMEDAFRDQRTQWSLEYRIKRLDGSVAWIAERANIVYHDDGRPARMVGGIVDITARKSAEEKLRESEELYRTVINTASEGMWLVDRNYDITFVNESMANMLGTTPAQLLGRNVAEFVVPEHLPLLKEQRRLRSMGQPGRFDIRIRNGEGDIRWVFISATPIFNRRGEFEGALAMCTDITERKDAEAALSEATERLTSIVQNAPIGIAIATPDGRIIDRNSAIHRMLGYSPEELAAKPFGFFTVREDLEREMPLFEELVAGKRAGYDIEKRYIRKDGTIFWGRVIVSSLKDADGKPSLLIGMVEDIDGRKRTEAELQYAKLRFERLKQSGVVGIVHYDSDGRYFDPNDAFLWMTGYTEEEIQQNRVGIHAITPPEYLHEETRAFVALTVHGSTLPFEKEFVRKDGRRVPVMISLVQLTSNTGIALILDISDLKRARYEVEQLARIVESTSDAVISLSREGLIQTWNPGAERLYGFAASEAIGASILSVVPDDRAHELNGLFAKVLDGQDLNYFESMRVSKSGQSIPVSLTISPIRDRGGQVISLSEIARDLTQVKNAELLQEKLRQAQRLEGIGRLAGGIAHDFNNLLMVITSYAEILQFNFGPDDRLRGHTDHILRAANRAAGLTQQLLAFSRKQVISPEVMDLNIVVDETTKMLHRLIGEDIELSFTAGKDIAPIKADPGQIVQVLMNLCVNARDAMPDGGRLTIRTSNVEIDAEYAAAHPLPPGSYVMLSVSDTGKGMADDVKARAFEPFFTTKPMGKGTGLGLATVYGIVNQSNGYIWFNSEPNSGTSFKIFFPPVSSDYVSSRAQQPEIPWGDETVLVVEDEPALRESVCEFLSSCGYQLLRAANGQEALEVAGRHQANIDLLLTDVVMPKISGRELAKRLSEQRPDTSILYMSGYTDDSIVYHGILEEGRAFLQKPFTLSALARKVRETIDSRVR